MIQKTDFIFRVLDVMETIDDDCDNMDVVFVAVKVAIFKLSYFYLNINMSRTRHSQQSTILMNFQL